MSDATWAGRTLTGGDVAGDVLRLDEPLSFWGGFDPHDGRVLDRNHPQHGAVLTGRVVTMAAGRGSSSSSSVLAEAIRLGTAPAALVLGEPDAIIALGALAAAELYGTRVPLVVVPRWRELVDGTHVHVVGGEPGGAATVTARATGPGPGSAGAHQHTRPGDDPGDDPNGTQGDTHG